MPDWVLPILAIVLGAGAGVTFLSFFRGVDLWRGRTAKTEARGIAFIERTWREDEWAKRVAIHRMEYYRDELNPHLRLRIARLEGVICRYLDETKLPDAAPEPLMRPLPERPPELVKGDNDGGPDAVTAGAPGE